MKKFISYIEEGGLWDNIRKRRASGKRMRKKGEKGAPTADAMRRAKGESVQEGDPKVGTGKKPKGSDRRLYTDENPKDTVSIKFATPADAKATVAKVKKIKKPYARKIQILTVGEQRAKVMGKNEVVSIFKKAKQDLKAIEKRKRVDEDAPTVNTGSIPNPADTAMGPRFKTRTVHDRRKKKGMPLLLKRFRDYYAEKGIG